MLDNVFPTGVEDPFPAGKAAPTSTPIVPHGYTLQFLISIIKKFAAEEPVATERMKDGAS